MILSAHIPIYEEIFRLPGFLSDPILCFGFQDVVFHDRVKAQLVENKQKRLDTVIYQKLRDEIGRLTTSNYYEVRIPHQFVESDLNSILRNHRLEKIVTLDLFDERADLNHDMNMPLQEELKGKFNTVIDIGSTEHVFDTRQCFENLLNLIAPNGQILLHTPCSGYFNHGFHTYSPECVIEALRMNGCDIEYIAYTLEPEGIKIDKPLAGSDVILWCVARKTRCEKEFQIPQQSGCQKMYGLTDEDFSDSQAILKPSEVKADAEFTEPLFLGLVTGENYGWGVCSQYLVKELSRFVDCRVLNSDDGTDQNPALDGLLFQAITGIDFFPMFEKARGRRNIGYTFFENELKSKSIENAGQYDLVLGGSSWCRDRMLEKGIHHCDVLIQGIDPDIHYPIDERPSRDRFVIFSGGKFELRKGQDLVLKAVKILQEKYDDILLVNCWYNIWPESMSLMAYSKHIQFQYQQLDWQDLMLKVYRENGLDPDRIQTCELVPKEMQRALYSQTDLGVFPNRCEGGTNLVLMEYMACGKPVVASYASGHRDVVNSENAMLLRELSPYTIVDANDSPFARWQEPSLDELVAQIEYAYHHREAVREMGKRAGRDMKNFTWRHTAQHLLDILYS